MVAVLMQGADPDQSRPRAREAANLATHGLRRRAYGERFPSNWEHAHANFMFPLRIAPARSVGSEDRDGPPARRGAAGTPTPP